MYTAASPSAYAVPASPSSSSSAATAGMASGLRFDHHTNPFVDDPFGGNHNGSEADAMSDGKRCTLAFFPLWSVRVRAKVRVRLVTLTQTLP